MTLGTSTTGLAMGLAFGTVTDLDDPQGEARIRVQFDWMPDGPTSAWAPVAVALAGDGRGAYVMPEIGDEAVVGFDRGDFEHPVVLGFLWNGVDRPPDDGIDPGVRRIRTVSGHVLEFDDRAGRERVLLTTQGGHALTLDDTAGTATLETTGGHTVALDDAGGSISIRSTGGQEVTIEDGIGITVFATGNIEAQALGDVSVQSAGGVNVLAAGSVAVTCVDATVTATSLSVTAATTSVTGSVQITGALQVTGAVSVSGVVQTQALVATAQTPGVGNLFGL